MTRLTTRCILAAKLLPITLGLLTMPLSAADYDTAKRVPHAVFTGEPTKRVAIESLKSSFSLRKQALPSALNLGELSETEQQRLEQAPLNNGRKAVVGIQRSTADFPLRYTASDLTWETHKEGETAILGITSSGAASLRVNIDLSTLPQGTEVRFYDESFYKPVGTSIRVSKDQAINHWSDSIEGDFVGIELFIPSNAPKNDFTFVINKVMHQLISKETASLKNNAAIGASGSCQIDVKCASESASNFSNLTSSVAKIVFIDDGFSYSCTGTLMNDADTSSEIPYFLTANHCVDSQTVANTLEFYWFFEKSTCSTSTANNTLYTAGGASLLKADKDYDYSFLKLNRTPPAGVSLSGWDANTIGSAGVYGIHHPSGDLKKYSSGLTYSFYDSFYGNKSNTHILVDWSLGVTETGSSGSGLWYRDGGSSYLVGILTGGSSACSTTQGIDLYGRFDQSYPALKGWLNNTNSSPAPTLGNITIKGQVVVAGTSIPVCGLVLANGTHLFSCNQGNYEITAPVDSEGKITLFAWADGFFPYKLVFTPNSSSTTQRIEMQRAP